MKYRSKVFTFMEILAALMEQPRLPTRLAQICNLNYVRLDEYTTPLLEKGLIKREAIDGHEVFKITGEGLKVHESWSTVEEAIFGHIQPS